jgi:hypothetical protein
LAYVSTKDMLSCVRAMTAVSAQAKHKLSAREITAYKAGLRAAHMEEALTQGDEPRAIAHAQALAAHIKELGILSR